MMWDGMSGWGWFGMIWMLVFWVGLIFLVVWVIRQFSNGSRPRSERHALDILKERFARGEIESTEFEERRRALEGR
jgi:putative membrane protein